MDFGDVLRRRRMVRRFTGEPITTDQAERIARAVTRAPTAGNSDGITVVSVTDPERIHALALACGEQDYLERGFDPWLSTAGQHVVLCAQPQRYHDRYAQSDKDQRVLDAIPWWWVDAGAALMTILLAAVDEGLTAGFHGGHNAEGARPLLGIPDAAELVGIVTVGHPAPDRGSSSLQRNERLDIIRYDRW